MVSLQKDAEKKLEKISEFKKNLKEDFKGDQEVIDVINGFCSINLNKLIDQEDSTDLNSFLLRESG